MDALLIAFAFFFGLLAQQFRLPPLVGFLIAGFVLQAFGQKGGAALGLMADLGVTLMLFTIGVKLRIRSLGRPEIWAGTSLHTLFVVLVFAIAIFGMGRVGLSAYKRLGEKFPGQVIGFDLDPAEVELHRLAYRNVMLADATDSDFWERAQMRDNIDLVILAIPNHTANVHAVMTLKRHGFPGVVTAAGKFDDEVKQLRDLGLDTAFNLYSEAGSGFAEHIHTVFSQQRPDLANAWRAKKTDNSETIITWPGSPKQSDGT